MNNALRSSPTRAQRRSPRIPLRVRLVIRRGNEAAFDTETVTISRYGAKLRIGAFDRKLACGDNVNICQRGAYIWRSARIAWVDRAAGTYCGIELQDAENFWSVRFPEKVTPDADDFAARRKFTPLAIRSAVPPTKTRPATS